MTAEMSEGDLVHALHRLGHEARVLAVTGSTNDDARAWAALGAPSGSVVIADAQTAGRGRHGRSWSTPPRSTLALSMVLRPALPPARLPPLAIVAGLATRGAIARTLEAAALDGRRVRVKWPNDVVVVHGESPASPLRKVAGVLIEAAISASAVENVVLGVGINVARTEFPEELREIATSLSLLGARDVDRGVLALELVASLDAAIAAHLADEAALAGALAPHDALRGRRVVTEEGAAGTADGLERDGRLRVRLDDGSIRLASAGEVRIAPA